MALNLGPLTSAEAYPPYFRESLPSYCAKASAVFRHSISQVDLWKSCLANSIGRYPPSRSPDCRVQGTPPSKLGVLLHHSASGSVTRRADPLRPDPHARPFYQRISALPKRFFR